MAKTQKHHTFLDTIPKLPTAEIALVASSWHEDIVSRLIKGAISVVHHARLNYEPVVFRVAGTYEIPQMLTQLAKSRQFEAIIPLGCIVRGETPHFELIAQTVFSAIDEVARIYGVAISNGILTVESAEQAKDRAGGEVGNKGKEAAHAALSLAKTMADVKKTYGQVFYEKA